MDGKQVELVTGPVTLRTADAVPRDFSMSFTENFLHTIADPNIAFILMIIGVNGILFELSSPGGYVAGLVGVICLLLALYAFGTLPVNYAGFLFIVLAFILFVADIKAATHGVLSAIGVVASPLARSSCSIPPLFLCPGC